MFDTDFKNGWSHQRLPVMEQLQDEMLVAALNRGTRPIEDQPGYFPSTGGVLSKKIHHHELHGHKEYHHD